MHLCAPSECCTVERRDATSRGHVTAPTAKRVGTASRPHRSEYRQCCVSTA